MRNKLIVLAFIVLFFLLEIYHHSLLVSFRSLAQKTYDRSGQNVTCTIINDKISLNQHAFKSLFDDIHVDFEHHSYIVSPGFQLTKIKKKSLRTHFVKLYFDKGETNQVYIYEVSNNKIYLDDRSGDDLIYR